MKKAMSLLLSLTALFVGASTARAFSKVPFVFIGFENPASEGPESQKEVSPKGSPIKILFWDKQGKQITAPSDFKIFYSSDETSIVPPDNQASINEFDFDSFTWSGWINVKMGDASASIPEGRYPVTDDNISEGDEKFRISLDENKDEGILVSKGNNSHIYTIKDDDCPGGNCPNLDPIVIGFEKPASEGPESQKEVSPKNNPIKILFWVKNGNPTKAPYDFEIFYTSDETSILPPDNQASINEFDFDKFTWSWSIEVKKGDAFAVIQEGKYPVTDDNIPEGDEKFRISLDADFLKQKSPSVSINPNRGEHVYTIKEDDVDLGGNNGGGNPSSGEAPLEDNPVADKSDGDKNEVVGGGADGVAAPVASGKVEEGQCVVEVNPDDLVGDTVVSAGKSVSQRVSVTVRFNPKVLTGEKQYTLFQQNKLTVEPVEGSSADYGKAVEQGHIVMSKATSDEFAGQVYLTDLAMEDLSFFVIGTDVQGNREEVKCIQRAGAEAMGGGCGCRLDGREQAQDQAPLVIMALLMMTSVALLRKSTSQ